MDEHEKEPVGYGNPPRQHRFSSENQPAGRGRKKGARGVRTELRKLLNTKVPIKVDGVRAKRPPLPIMLFEMMKEALEGNRRSRTQFLDLVMRVLGNEDWQEGNQRLSAEAEGTLARYVADYLAEQAAPDPDDPQNPSHDGGSDDEA